MCKSGAAGGEGQGEAGGRRLSERFSKSALSVGTLSPAALLTHSHHTHIHRPHRQDAIGNTQHATRNTHRSTQDARHACARMCDYLVCVIIFRRHACARMCDYLSQTCMCDYLSRHELLRLMNVLRIACCARSYVLCIHVW